jgi:hypothetical protein
VCERERDSRYGEYENENENGGDGERAWTREEGRAREGKRASFKKAERESLRGRELKREFESV